MKMIYDFEEKEREECAEWNHYGVVVYMVN